MRLHKLLVASMGQLLETRNGMSSNVLSARTQPHCKRLARLSQCQGLFPLGRLSRLQTAISYSRDQASNLMLNIP